MKVGNPVKNLGEGSSDSQPWSRASRSWERNAPAKHYPQTFPDLSLNLTYTKLRALAHCGFDSPILLIDKPFWQYQSHSEDAY